MDDWHVGDPVGFGNDIGAPEVPYMSYVKRDSKKDPDERTNKDALRGESLQEEAQILERQKRYDEALVFINRAMEIHPDIDNLNVKAMILENSGRFGEALECYDRSLKVSDSRKVRASKASCLYKIAEKNFDSGEFEDALEHVNRALAVLPEDEARDEYLLLKSDILHSLGRNLQARKCRLLAEKRFDELRKLEKGEDEFQNDEVILICITGTQHYMGLEPFRQGLVVELFEEAGNDYDPDAVRVEITGETVGYVANSPATLAEGVKSASQIKRLFKNKIEAEILRVENGNVIARLKR